MIRRIQKSNDYKDYIAAKPKSILDKIYKIEYFVKGYEKVYEAEFQRDLIIIAIIPSQELSDFENGILYRRCYYKEPDSAYPDTTYDLVIEDNLNVWLGDDEVTEKEDKGYITAEDLKTINNQLLVGEGDIEVLTDEQKYLIEQVNDKADRSELPDLSPYAKKTDLPDLQPYAKKEDLQNKADRSELTDYTKLNDFANFQNYAYENFIQESQLGSYYTKTEADGMFAVIGQLNTINGQSLYGYDGSTDIQISGTISDDEKEKLQNLPTNEQIVENYATKVEIAQAGYLTPGSLKTINNNSLIGEGNIEIEGSLSPEQEEKIAEIDNKADKSELTDYAKKTDIPDLSGYATENWVESKGYLTEHQDLTPYAKKSDIPDVSNFATTSYVDTKIDEIDLSGYATENWVESKGYLTEHQDLTPYAKKTDLPDLSGYATETWVESKGYLTEHQDISGKVDRTDIWTGTEAEWNALPDSQKNTYLIALVR